MVILTFVAALAVQRCDECVVEAIIYILSTFGDSEQDDVR